MKIIWLDRALKSLEEAADYIAQDSPKIAGLFLKRTAEAVEKLKDHPSMGRTGRVFGTRELILTDFPYILPYRVQDREIQILHLLHSSRKWPVRL